MRKVVFKSNKKNIAIFSCILIAIVLTFSIFNLNKRSGKNAINIDALLKSEAYNYLPDQAIDYIKDYYEETGDIILTEKNKETNELYLNPLYVEYLSLPEEERENVSLIPANLVIDYIPGKNMGETPSLPSSYLDEDYLTPIKNQDKLGICWSMATTEVAESYLLASTSTKYSDGAKIFSPRKLDYVSSSNGIIGYTNEYHHHNVGGGGNFQISSVLLGSGLGLSDNSWEVNNNKGYTENASDVAPLDYETIFNYNTSDYEVDSTIIMPEIDNATKEEKETWMNIVKQNIINYGSAYIGTISPQSGDENDCPIIYDGKAIIANDGKCSTAEIGHAMQIIGWDDNFEYKYCSTEIDANTTIHSDYKEGCPSGNIVTGKGAWILKNSWGESFGKYTNPYVTYDSVKLEIGFVNELNSLEDKIWDNEYISNQANNWYFNGASSHKFTRNLNASETVNKVKFVAIKQNTTYDITMIIGNKEYTKKVEVTLPGLYTVDFSDKNINLSKKEFKVNVSEPVFSAVQVFTTNNTDDVNISVPETYIDKTLGERYIVLETRNLDSEEVVDYSLYDSKGEKAISTDDYEITHNIVGANKINLKLNIKNNLDENGYILKSNYSENSSSGLVTYQEGSGTEQDPYIIKTPNQLYLINDNMNAYYKLGADIDLTAATKEGGEFYNEGKGWLPIGLENNYWFRGSFDGNNHTIKGLHSSNDVAGLFYIIDGATIKNLTLDDFVIDNSNIEKSNGLGSGALSYDIRKSSYSTKNTTIENININNYISNSNLNSSVLSAYIESTTDATDKIIIKNIYINNPKITSTNYTGILTSYIQTYIPLEIDGVFITEGEATTSDWMGVISASMTAGNNINVNRVFNTTKLSTTNEYYNTFGLVTGSITSLSGNSINISNFESLETIKFNNSYYSSMVGDLNSKTDSNINFNNIILLNNNDENNISKFLNGYVRENNGSINLNNIYSNNYSKYINNGALTTTQNIDNKSVEDLIDTDLFSSWTDFDDNWVSGDQDDIARIPIIKGAPFVYTTVNPITVQIEKTVDIFDYLAPDIDLAKNITWEIDDTDIATIDKDGIITAVAEGDTVITVKSNYDGYQNDVELTVTPGPQIIFNANYGEEPEIVTQKIPKEDSYSLNANTFKRDGYTFKGWSTEANGEGTTYLDGATVTFTEEKVLYAMWEANEYTIKFDGNGSTSGTMTDETRTYDEDAKALTENAYEKVGYTFKGWSTTETGDVEYEDKASVNNLTSGVEITLYAVWKANEYTVKFDGNGSSSDAMDNETGFKYDEAKALSKNTYEKVGYTFTGWSTTETGDVEYEDEELVTNLTAEDGKTVTLYAVWEANEYTVKYDGNGSTSGTMSDESRTYDEDAKALTENAYEKVGYTFIGWSTTETGDVKYEDKAAVNNLTSDTEITLYAVWEANTYTVKFDGNGSTSGTMTDELRTYDEDAKALTENVYKRAGYTFTGWSTTTDGDVEYEDKATVNNLTSGTEVTLYAVWEANTYTVKYDGNGSTSGTMTDELRTYDEEAKALTENAYEKAGYTFTGWNTESDGKGTSYSDKAAVNNLTSGTEIILYAVWEANEYTIKFDGNGSTSGTMTDELRTYDEEAKALTENLFTRVGYTFTGWSTTTDGDVEYEDKATVNNLTSGAEITLYAVWKANTYKIVFNANGGEGTAMDDIANVAYGEEITLPTSTYTKTGNDFYGWSLVSTDSEATYEDGEKVSNLTSEDGKTVTLYAIYGLHQYTITFDSDGGSEQSEIKKSYGLEITLPIPTKEGYTFEGWYNDSEKFEGTTMPAQDLALKAHWKANTYTVKFDGNGSSSDAMDNETGFKYDEAKALSKNTYEKVGYTFTGWSTTETGDVEYEDEELVTNLTAEDGKTVTLYAVWEANEYTVKYDGNGSTSGTMSDESRTYDEEAKALTQNSYEKVGYTFKGWNTASDGKGTSYSDKATVNNLTSGTEITLYAVWEANTYTVKYDGNGSTSGTMTDELRTYDEEAKALTENVYKRAGYTFTGWSTTTDGDVEYEDKATVNNLTEENEATITLYAVWSINKYKIIFDSKGGNTFDTIEKDYNTEVTLPIPEKKGYTFDGWYNGKTKLGEKINLTEDLSLVAKWKVNTYTIAYNANGGEGEMTSESRTYGEEAKALTENLFTRVGYTFQGWSTTTDGDVEYEDKATVNNLTEENEATITLYAVWSINKYKITFDSKGGNTFDTIEQNYNTEITLPTPTKEGYTFKGWYDSDEEFKSTTMPAKNLDLVAKWEANTYTIVFDANGGEGKMTSETRTYDEEELALPQNIFTKENYKFVGWALTETGDVKYADKEKVNNLTTENEATVTLYAVWDEYYGITIKEYGYDKTNKYIIAPLGENNTDFESNIKTDSGYSIVVDYKLIESENKVYTGGKTKVYKDTNLVVEYTNIVRGDLNGDGLVDIADLAKMYNHYKGNITMEGAYHKAASITTDDTVDIADLAKMYNYYKGNISKI
ncbi:MAG: InlB B-repeat-containing protein [bacterium]|nr:InlB B-repeat-containing protein [bacterium]